MGRRHVALPPTTFGQPRGRARGRITSRVAPAQTEPLAVSHAQREPPSRVAITPMELFRTQKCQYVKIPPSAPTNQ
jgi:hypothetical protein